MVVELVDFTHLVLVLELVVQHQLEVVVAAVVMVMHQMYGLKGVMVVQVLLFLDMKLDHHKQQPQKQQVVL